ncbi:MAG: hypothetical protein EZS28_024965 [Streblomastix strix]|uniref:Uncharacterized protein n=1 Tax=Streblomastix strix TaxID=222440 RepID=A0A5J4VA85_9EUKA|nr:MAG: hypothetical protein EZS28_024965 [Streblomastix strix]
MVAQLPQNKVVIAPTTAFQSARLICNANLFAGIVIYQLTYQIYTFEYLPLTLATNGARNLCMRIQRKLGLLSIQSTKNVTQRLMRASVAQLDIAFDLQSKDIIEVQIYETVESEKEFGEAIASFLYFHVHCDLKLHFSEVKKAFIEL